MFTSTRADQCFKLKLVYWLCNFCITSKREKRLAMQIEAGERKIEKALDIKTLIKHQRAFYSVLRLEYGPKIRKLLNFQRRQTVLEARQLPKDLMSSSEEDIFSDNDIG